MNGRTLSRQALALAGKVADEAVRLRRDFHQHPEIGFQEKRTTAVIAEFLAGLGLEVVRPRRATGVIGRLLPGGAAARRRPAIALRADIDALPVEEQNRTSFCSQNRGVGHLCGHDAHTGMLLAAARALAGIRERLPRPVTFIFQPAEECIPNGAPVMIAAGALRGVGEVYGLHVAPDRPLGVISNRVGPNMASMDRFDMEVIGRGGHGAIPHKTSDPVVATAAVIQALQTVVSRRIDPLEPAVVSVCTLSAPGAFNVIPDRVELKGTCRSLSPEVHAALPLLVRSLAAGAARANGCRIRMRYSRGTPVLVNSAAGVEKVRRLWRGLVACRPGGLIPRREPVAEGRPTMGGEDFAFYLQKLPGAFCFLGAAPAGGMTGSYHNPRFTLDERALVLGVALHVALALEG
jgi:amidohydrolase